VAFSLYHRAVDAQAPEPLLLTFPTWLVDFMFVYLTGPPLESMTLWALLFLDNAAAILPLLIVERACPPGIRLTAR